MIGSEPSTLGVYLFSRKGTPLLALPSAEQLPLDPSQVEGVLALAGGFDRDAFGNGRHEPVARVKYDGYGILGLRGDHAVVATVSRGTPEEALVPELERFLRRCEKRLRRQRQE